ncbi:MAG: pyridoxamine 5'-phosphate oxidase family protein [Bacteroidales bacterium]|nr:pyridoxamine 5'-phosphate oxidase family protein [Bacteroidales bacterium]
MNKPDTIKEYIEGILKASRFAVLATEGDGQPHASLIAITPFGNYRQLVFATYRNTAKYRNLDHNSKVAVLIESGDDIKGSGKTIVLTITGRTEEINRAENEEAFIAHLKEHPELKSFMLSPDCAIFLVIAQSYQVVYGVDDIKWIAAEDLDSI